MFDKGKGSVKVEEEERSQKIMHFETYFKNLEPKFQEIKKEINEMPKNVDLFKNHQLPLARIKKIMKSDEDVRVNQSPSRWYLQKHQSSLQRLAKHSLSNLLTELGPLLWNQKEELYRYNNLKFRKVTFLPVFTTPKFSIFW